MAAKTLTKSALMQKAAEAAAQIESPARRAQVLQTLGAREKDAARALGFFDEALSVIEALPDEERRRGDADHVQRRRTAHLLQLRRESEDEAERAAYAEKAVSAAESLTDPAERAELLSTIASEMPDDAPAGGEGGG